MDNTVTLPNAVNAPTPEASEEDKPRNHVRAPELHRNRTKLAMTAAAVIGAAAGARLLFGDTSEPLMYGVSQTLVGAFGEVFLRQLLLCAAFLAAEFILGFFAFGDLAVWGAPFLYGAGTVLRVAAGTAKMLPGGLFCLAGVVFGAAYSADMSGLLLRLTCGGCTVYMDSRPRRAYVLGFLGCLAAVMLGAILMAVLSGVP